MLSISALVYLLGALGVPTSSLDLQHTEHVGATRDALLDPADHNTHTSPVLQRPLTLAVARQRAMSEAEPTMDPTTMG